MSDTHSDSHTIQFSDMNVATILWALDEYRAVAHSHMTRSEKKSFESLSSKISQAKTALIAEDESELSPNDASLYYAALVQSRDLVENRVETAIFAIEGKIAPEVLIDCIDSTKKVLEEYFSSVGIDIASKYKIK